ncbi:MAG: TolC family protein [Isosphaeraceae bacterium]
MSMPGARPPAGAAGTSSGTPMALPMPMRMPMAMPMDSVTSTTLPGGRITPPPGVPATPLSELEGLAVRTNPTLVQARAQVDASLSKSLQAGLLPNPIAGYVSEQMGTGGGPGETQGWFAEQEIPRGGKLRLSRAKYRQEAAQAQIQVQAQTLRVINDVRISYFEVLAAQRMLAVERHLLTNFEEMARTTRELVNVGQANRPDLLQAQVAVQRQRVKVRAAENRLRKSRVDLATVIGVPELPFEALEDDLEREGPPLEWDAALHQILTCSPEIQVARAEVLRDEITVRRERVQPVPNIFTRVENGYNFEENAVTTGVQVGWSLPILNRNQGTIREAMAEVTRARAEVARLELVLRHRLAETFTHYQTALATVQVYRDETLPQAREAYELTLRSYRQRRTPWVHVVTAERTYSDVNEEYLEALLELRRTEVAIRGMLLVGGLSLPEPPTPGGHIDATPQPR